MQSVIEATRTKLAPFLGGDIPALPTIGVHVPPRPIFHENDTFNSYSRVVRQIPRDNYENLTKLVPISWL